MPCDERPLVLALRLFCERVTSYRWSTIPQPIIGGRVLRRVSMRFSSNIVAVSLLTLALAGCSGGGTGGGNQDFSGGGTEDIGEPLAHVNGMAVGAKEFDQMASRRGPNDQAMDLAARKEVMNKLVEEKLLYQEAVRQKIDRDPKIQKMMVNTLLKKEVYGTIKNGDISDDELKKYFDEHKDDFIVPAKVQIKDILVKIQPGQDEAAAKKEADRIRGEVQAKPDSFKDLAIKYSQGPYARRGGDLGFVSQKGKPGIDQKIVDEAFKMEKDQVSQVIKADDGFHIIMVANKREQVERTFDQMKSSVLRKVKSDKYKELYDNYVAKLRQGAKIEMDDKKLEAHKIEKKAGPPPGGLPMPGGEEGEEGGPMPGGAIQMPGAEGGMPPGMHPIPPGMGMNKGEAAPAPGAPPPAAPPAAH